MEGLSIRTSMPRRPHRKTRTGCVQCKKRKIKCDETKPTCKKCNAYGSPCSFLQTNPLKITPQSTPISPFQRNPLSPNSSILTQLQSTPSLAFTLLDLEILHFWTTTAAFHFNNNNRPNSKILSSQLLQVTFVELAFSHPFLMHEILSLSALHMAYERTDKDVTYKHVSVAHHAKALPIFQAEVCKTGPENSNACFAFVTLMNIHEWAFQNSDETLNLYLGDELEGQSKFAHEMHWLRLYRGGGTFLRAILPLIENGPISPLFKALREFDFNGPTPMTLEEKIHLDSLAETWNKNRGDQSPMSAEHKEMLEKALQLLRVIFSLSTANIELSKHAVTIAWITMISDEYVQMIEAKVPEALLVLAHYCVLLKRLEYMWWVKGKAESLLEAIRDEVGEGWDRWLKWPIDVVTGTEDKWNRDRTCMGCHLSGQSCVHIAGNRAETCSSM